MRPLTAVKEGNASIRKERGEPLQELAQKRTTHFLIGNDLLH